MLRFDNFEKNIDFLAKNVWFSSEFKKIILKNTLYYIKKTMALFYRKVIINYYFFLILRNYMFTKSTPTSNYQLFDCFSD